MTIETKTTLQLSDITAIEFECKSCHRIVSLPLPAKSPQQVPIACDCNMSQQWMIAGGDMYRSLLTLLNQIQRIAEATNEPFSLRFVTVGLSGRASGGKD